MTDKEIFGRNVRIERVRKGLTQAQLGDALGVKQNTISTIETGVCFPEMQLAIDLSRFFNVTFEDMLKNHQTN